MCITIETFQSHPLPSSEQLPGGVTFVLERCEVLFGALTGQSAHVVPMHREGVGLTDILQVIVCSSHAFDEAFELLSVIGIVGIAALAFQVIDDDAHEVLDLIGARLIGQRC